MPILPEGITPWPRTRAAQGIIGPVDSRVQVPKTRSRKILRGTMPMIADAEQWNMPATVDDPAIMEEITLALQDRGLARSARGRTLLTDCCQQGCATVAASNDGEGATS